MTSMLKVDPTTYRDVNPLVSTAAGASPTAQQIAGKPTVSPSPTASAGATAAGGPSAAPAWLLPVLVGGGIILLLVILAIVLVIVFATRRARQKTAVK